MAPYPSSLQHLGPAQARLVHKHLLLLVAVGLQLHLGVDGIQVPAERAALQPPPQRLPLAHVPVGPLTQLGPQREVLLLGGGDRGDTADYPNAALFTPLP